MEDVDLAPAPLTTAVLAVVAVCLLFASGTAAASWKPLYETDTLVADSPVDAPASLAASLASPASAERPTSPEGTTAPGPSRLAEGGRVAEREGSEGWSRRKPTGSQEDISTEKRRNLGNRDFSDNNTSRYRRSSRQLQDNRGPKVSLGAGVGGAAQSGEEYSIQPRNIPFLSKQRNDGARNAITIMAMGEPKSGTTWLGRLLPQLALELCGSPSNTWCEMGGLAVYPNEPSPYYEFEMLDVRNREKGGEPTLFLHFVGRWKHVIPGMTTSSAPKDCQNGGRKHRNFFQDEPVCTSGLPPTRERLRGCLWDTSPRCFEFGKITADKRTAVIVRDPREVILSERKMRADYYHHAWVKKLTVDEFVRQRFETLVSWTHQRWVWHTQTAMNASSHVIFYEDLQADYLGMVDLAAFMGLDCSSEQAKHVWLSHQSSGPPRDYTTQGLEVETIEWMNATMARLLPVPMVYHYGLVPTDL